MAESPFGTSPTIEIQMPAEGIKHTGGGSAVVTGNTTKIFIGGQEMRFVQELTINVKKHELATIAMTMLMPTDDNKPFRIKGRLLIDEYEELDAINE
jgi:hypothetical protein